MSETQASLAPSSFAGLSPNPPPILALLLLDLRNLSSRTASCSATSVRAQRRRHGGARENPGSVAAQELQPRLIRRRAKEWGRAS